MGAGAASPRPRAGGRVRLRRACLSRRAGRGCTERAGRRRPGRGRGARNGDRRGGRAPAAVRERPLRPGPARLDARARRAPTTSATGSTAGPTRAASSAGLRELRRVLAADGSLLVTVPLGEPGPTAGSGRRTCAAGRATSPAPASSSRSWSSTSSEGRMARRPTFSADGVRYGDRGPAASAVLCADLGPRRLRRLVTPDGLRRTARRRLGPRWRRLRPRRPDTRRTASRLGACASASACYAHPGRVGGSRRTSARCCARSRGSARSTTAPSCPRSPRRRATGCRRRSSAPTAPATRRRAARSR